MRWRTLARALLPAKLKGFLRSGDKGKVFVARSLALRWRDEADRLINRPRWWQSLPSPPGEEATPKAKQRTKTR